jgi:hypothetical protein
MHEKDNRVFLSLTGGLGNQLFQLAAGLNLAGNRKLSLVTELGSPRKSKDGKADLLSFSLPKGVELLQEKKANWITRKTAGFMLRKGLAPTRIEKNIIFVFFSKLFANIVMTVFLRSKVAVLASSDVGYSSMHMTKAKIVLFGYFQSYRWAEKWEILNQLRSIAFLQDSELIEQFSIEAEIELPLIVHVRLGDYLSEKNFGIPSKDYYKVGINKILSSRKCKSIWLFSDDLEKAREYIPIDISIPVRMIPEIENSAAATLEVMRFGVGYVIANSTFSWWAAFLSKEPNVEVIAPEPWFQGMDEPRDLIPSTWQRIDAGYLSSTP